MNLQESPLSYYGPQQCEAYLVRSGLYENEDTETLKDQSYTVSRDKRSQKGKL